MVAARNDDVAVPVNCHADTGRPVPRLNRRVQMVSPSGVNFRVRQLKSGIARKAGCSDVSCCVKCNPIANRLWGEVVSPGPDRVARQSRASPARSHRLYRW